MNDLPFTEISLGNNEYLREFHENIDTHELEWHIDKEDRIVEVVKNDGWEIQIDKLRKMLGLVDKYEQFFDFNTKILQPAFKEINEKSEYVTEVDFLKNGKQYSSLLVSVTLKKEFVKQSEKHYTQLKSFGLDAWQIRNITNTLSESEIDQHLNHVRMNAHAIQNKGGYLVKTFKAVGVPLDKALF